MALEGDKDARGDFFTALRMRSVRVKVDEAYDY